MGEQNQSSTKVDTNKPYYNKEIGPQLGPVAIEIFRDYSDIPEEEIEQHCYDIRDRAWRQWPYPCIGQFRFLDCAISAHPQYPAILARLKTEHEVFLDLGCCFGQDLRKLIFDGVPQKTLYAADINTEFFDLGKTLFKDEDRLDVQCIEADVLQPHSALDRLHGKVDILYAASLLHLFGWEKQLVVCEAMVRLLKPVKGSMVVGRQVGNLKAHEDVSTTRISSQSTWVHNEDSFKRLWKEVGEKTGTQWSVDVDMSKPFDVSGSKMWLPEGSRGIIFTVIREIDYV